MLRHLVSYQDKRVDGFFSDNTVVIIHGSSIDYYSETGIKATIKAQQIPPVSSLSNKITQVLKKYNRYSNRSQYISSMVKEQQQVVKTNRITESIWSSIVQQSKFGYRLWSIDRTAYVEINFSGMLVKVSYLQQINDQCLVDKIKNEKNFAKDLLTKYNFEYQEYPEAVKIVTVGYKYIREEKVYVLNKIPERWGYAVSIIWKHIRSKIEMKPIIQPISLVKNNITFMEKISFIEQQQEIKIENIGVPVFRYPRHCSLVSLMLTINESEQNIGWIGQGQAICFDSQGYWILSYESLHLKFTNTIESEKIYNVNAVPLFVRVTHNNYQKNVKDFLIAVYNASAHRPLSSVQTKLSQIQKLSTISSKTTQQSTQIHKIYNQYGIFSIMSNHIVTARFNDGLFIISNYLTNTVKIKDKDGNSLTTNLNDKFYSQYLKIINYYYQSIYHPEQFKEKSRAQEEIEQKINFYESVVQHIGSGDYLKKTYNDSIKQDLCNFNMDEIIRKNEEMLKKLQKYK